ncbi:MAG: hypothetical protein GY862_32360, partial [Gammaproteobacteria bacterium]|nr:hypothetical protein [Gammaproteobacteria bacterium]
MKKIIAAVGKYISKKSNDEEAGKEPVLADNMQDEDKVSIPVDNDSVGDYITRMGRLEAELKMSEAELDKEIAGVTERHAKEAVDTVRKWSSLDSAIRAYDKANRRKLFPNPDKLKTCKFSMGKVSIRMKAISLKVNL